MATLSELRACEVLDTRGHPTVAVEALASTGARGRAIVPSGSGEGGPGASELRDGDDCRFNGRGVRRAVGHVRSEIAGALRGLDLDDQAAIDARLVELDGTPGNGRLGSNASLGVSLAAAHAASAARGEELYVHLNRLWRDRLDPGEEGEPSLPLPMVAMISGGLHDGPRPDFQNFLILPVGARSMAEAVEMAAAVYGCLGRVLRAEGEQADLVGDDGSYVPGLRSGVHVVKRVLEAVLSCNYRLGDDITLGLDVAANRLRDPVTDLYHLRATGDVLDAAGMIALLRHWTREFPIASIEGALADDDRDGWAALTARLGGTVQIVGGSLFRTQPDLLREGAGRALANAALIRMDEVGTLSEALDAIRLARRLGLRPILAAGAGETEDATLADLAVATGVGQIKVGSVARSERLAKYNRLLQIESQIGPAPFVGRAALAR